jgi:hypothetical protein
MKNTRVSECVATMAVGVRTIIARHKSEPMQNARNQQRRKRRKRRTSPFVANDLQKT